MRLLPLFLLFLFVVVINAQLELPPLGDYAMRDRSRQHSLMGPCLDRDDSGQFCDKLKRFCNDFKYQTLINKECRATCGRC